MSNAISEATASHSASRGVGGTEDDEEVGREVGSSRHSNGSLLCGGEKKASGGKRDGRGPQRANLDDTDGLSSGNDSAERECEGHGGRETSTCSSHNGKDSVMETTESKR